MVKVMIDLMEIGVNKMVISTDMLQNGSSTRFEYEMAINVLEEMKPVLRKLSEDIIRKAGGGKIVEHDSNKE